MHLPTHFKWLPIRPQGTSMHKDGITSHLGIIGGGGGGKEEEEEKEEMQT